MVEVVSKRGYPDTRVVDVIQAAKVSRKTFYELFDDKEDCFLAAYDGALAVLYEHTSQAFESTPEVRWADRLRNGLAAFLGVMAEQPSTAKFCIVDALAAGPRALARRDAAVRQFTSFIEAGRAETPHELPGITALSLAGGINELLYNEILHGATSQLPGRLPELMYWITLPFLGSNGAAKERDTARNMIAGGSDGAVEQGSEPFPR